MSEPEATRLSPGAAGGGQGATADAPAPAGVLAPVRMPVEVPMGALADHESTESTLAVAHECGRYVWNCNPYLRMLAVSGSLTRPEHRGPHADADYFVLAQQGRVWQAFFGCLVLGWRFARRRGIPRKFFCFNYLVDESHPEEIDLSRPEYVAEFLRLDVIAGHAAYLDLLATYRSRLQSCEPDLYVEARDRVRSVVSSASGSGAGRSGSGSHAGAMGAVYVALKAPFMLIAKLMEARRRRLYPGGHVYSNRRVIRSHFRRAWGDSQVDADALPGSAAFTDVAATYDEEFAASPANRHMRAVVHARLARWVHPGTRALDLGCGTGIDAVWLAQRGATVLAIDVSQGMVDAAARRVHDEGLQDRVEVRRLAVEQLLSLLPAHSRSFDLVLANFGALNMSGDPERWGPVIARLLKPGGRLVASVMNRESPWELVAGLLRLRLSFALRRLRGDPIRVGNVPLAVRLYSPGGLSRRLRQYFRFEDARGLCVFVPPPSLEHLGRLVPGEWRLLSWLDRTLGRFPVMRAAGDHFLIELRQDASFRFDRRGFGAVTASPVVSDINGDGVPEVMVAAARMHILDTHGRNLRGWPRRIGAPMASTPAVVGAGDSATVFVGSDDDHLYSFGLDGREREGFPVRTGGDVFSSPLWIDGHGDGQDGIVFGSDDGRVHAVDGRGRMKRGWPFETGGFVSASPTPIDVAGRAAIAIGSWDGSLYLLDLAGRLLPGWPAGLGSAVWGSAAAADIDGDGRPEIAVATDRLFVFSVGGMPLRGFPVSLGAYAVGSPAVGDIDRDGRLEVVVASDRVYAFRDDGRPVAGFPFDTGSYLWASPILIDVDGDGYPEIVVGDFAGRLWAITHRGGVIDGYPLKPGRRITAAATAADIDGDRFLELIVATGDGRLVALATECPDDQSHAPWPAFLASRSARLARPSGIPGPSGIPWHGVEAGAPGPVQETRGQQVCDGDPSVHVRPYRAGEVSLDTPDDLRVTGMLYYSVDGRVHPSPLLKSGTRHFSLIQPLPPLKMVTFSFRLSVGGDREVRVPSQGAYRFRVGLPGLGIDRNGR